MLSVWVAVTAIYNKWMEDSKKKAKIYSDSNFFYYLRHYVKPTAVFSDPVYNVLETDPSSDIWQDKCDNVIKIIT